MDSNQKKPQRRAGRQGENRTKSKLRFKHTITRQGRTMKTDAKPEVKKSSTTPQEQAESPHSEPRKDNSSAVVWRDVPSALIRAPLVDIDWRQAEP